MIDQKLIDRINELAAISKERELTFEEVKERDNLRKEYLKQFKAGFKQQLDSIKFEDPKN